MPQSAPCVVVVAWQGALLSPKNTDRVRVIFGGITNLTNPSKKYKNTENRQKLFKTSKQRAKGDLDQIEHAVHQSIDDSIDEWLLH